MATTQISYNYQHVSGAGTFIVHNGPCTLQSISVNAPGTLCTIYDNNAGSGVVIAAINTTGSFNNVIYGVRCNKGITVVTTGAGTDITVTFGPVA
jgi:hypothetical protein